MYIEVLLPKIWLNIADGNSFCFCTAFTVLSFSLSVLLRGGVREKYGGAELN